MNTHAISPYDRPDSISEKKAMMVLAGSIVLHILVFWLFIFVLPGLSAKRVSTPDKGEDVYPTFELRGDDNIAEPTLTNPANPQSDSGGRQETNVTADPQTGSGPSAEYVMPIFSDNFPTGESYVIPMGQMTPEKLPEITQRKGPPVGIQVPQVKPVPQAAAPNQEADTRNAVINDRIADIKKRREANLQAANQGGGITQEGERIDPEKANYYGQIADIVASNWLAPGDDVGSNLVAIYMITIEPGGRVSASRLVQSSGSVAYDLSVERAVRGSVFPPLPDVFEGQAISPAFRFNSDKMKRGAALI